MMAAFIEGGAPWIGAGLAVFGAAAGCWALVGRSFLLSSLWVAIAGACCAGAMVAFGAIDAALLTTAVVAGWAPLLILGASLLGVDRVAPARAPFPWASFAGASAVALVVAGVIFMESGASDVRTIAPHQAGVGALALMVFAAVVGAVALLGYGERGGLGRRDP